MTRFGEAEPDIPVEYVLTPEEAQEFQDTVLWGTVNYLWHGDFLTESRDGEDVHFCKKVIGVEGPIRVQISARAWNEYDHDEVDREGPRLTHCLNLRLEKMCAELTDSMMSALHKVDIATGIVNTGDELHSNEARLDDYDDDHVIHAWEVKEFYLDDSSDSNMDIESFHELQDVDGEVLDDDTSISWGVVDGGPLSGRETDILDELDGEISGSMTYEEKCRILAMFAMVGLPVDASDPRL